jgi:hypothetical protein
VIRIHIKFGDQTWDMLTAADPAAPGNYNWRRRYPAPMRLQQTRRTGVIPAPRRAPTTSDHLRQGDLKIQANSIAQGVLLVDGSVEMAGNFTFNGIMVVKNDIKSTGNGNKITGSAFAGNTYTADNTSINGNSEIQYSSCAIERAGKAAATIVRAKERGFAEIIQ